ncbi:hypothetical protein [Pectobacterium versatile]|uniref:hypothetical protein n=1 Tax=Pectobacterium versatile TaxID=2488639 RepID=UPI003BFA6C82
MGPQGLIDVPSLKGFQLGGAAVHEKQALVLINKNKAKSSDIVELLGYVPQHSRKFPYRGPKPVYSRGRGNPLFRYYHERYFS